MADNGSSKTKPSSSGKPRDNSSRSRDRSKSTSSRRRSEERKDGKPKRKSSKSKSPTERKSNSTKKGQKSDGGRAGKPAPWWKNKTALASQTQKVEDKPATKPIVYTGRSKGSTQVKRSVSQNLEFSQFILLVRYSYDAIVESTPSFPETCPFAMYQHYCCTVLNAFLLDLAAKNNTYQECLHEQPALEQIRAAELWIPQVIYDYIICIGNSISPSDDVVVINIPHSAIPNGRDGDITSGTFGHCNAQTHNLYECYISPYVTAQYITSTIVSNTLRFVENWDPLPADYTPAGGVPTENLLGYWPIEHIPDRAVDELNRCLFENSNNILGRLRFSRNVMENTSIKLAEIREVVKMEQANFVFHETGALFITKSPYEHGNPRVRHTTRLTRINTYLKSPFAFGLSAANRANFFGYRRFRTMFENGPCYTDRRGHMLLGWLATRNANFGQYIPFQPGGQLELGPLLNEFIHFESNSSGWIDSDLQEWIKKLSLK